MTTHPVKRRKKLIEVAIPLEAINAASAREKSIRHGHPSTLHLWWARRPLAAARAVIFCQMVDDPSAVPEEFSTEEAQENERLRLFALISELVTWENTTNEQVLNRAREEIRRSWRRCCADNADHPDAAELFNPEKLPGFHDPFAGGGALPLEAQRLGLEAYASDLNPVAVLINKAMIEIPPKFAGMPPVNPESRSKKELIVRQWKGAEGLAEDVRYYGQWMRDEAEKRIGHLYPKIEITAEMAKERPDLNPYVGCQLTVIAWLWARTVKSPNPAFSHIEVPLASTFLLSTKAGKEAYVDPEVTPAGYRFIVKQGAPKDVENCKIGTKQGRGSFRCLMSGSPIGLDYVRSEAQSCRLGKRLMAIIAEGDRGRVYLSPSQEHEAIAKSADPQWRPDLKVTNPCHDVDRLPMYGMPAWGDAFTSRQLTALSTFSSLVDEARSLAKLHATSDDYRGSPEAPQHKEMDTISYPDAIGVYLSFGPSRAADAWSSITTWMNQRETIRSTFAKQAIQMTWDYAEVNPFSRSCGNWMGNSVEWIEKSLVRLPLTAIPGKVEQKDAGKQRLSVDKVVSTDPPYYDNIGYADLSDFFYVWLRRSAHSVYPELFATLSTPKSEELVATPYRHGGKKNAEIFFLEGMTHALRSISSNSHCSYPVTIYYAFKQSETKSGSGTASTGWETFLGAVLRSGLVVKGTWPVRTEREGRSIGIGTNALASSIVLVCEKRLGTADNLSRSEFRRILRSELPRVIKDLENANIAPVDVAQAAIGPGMSIFSSAKAVLNPDDSQMSVREALVEINTALDEYLSQDEGELDADSRFALTFFESFGYAERDFGDAEGLAKARNVSVEGVAKAGIFRSVAGKAWLLRREQLNEDWDPSRDDRLCVWEATQHLIKRLEAGGEGLAAELLAQLKRVAGHGDLAANCRALAYRLYNHCEKTKQAEEARAYNGLVIAWPELERLAASQGNETTVQASLI